MDARQNFWQGVLKYWWVIVVLILLGAFLTPIPIFKYLTFVVAGFFLIIIFFPFLFNLFAPAVILVSSLTQHFKESQNMPFGKKFIFIPMALLSLVLFVIAQTTLAIWVFVISFFVWVSVIGSFWSILLIFFFGLAPIAIITAPFVVWWKAGFVSFLGIFIFFLMTLFWYGLSNLALSKDYYPSTPDDFLGYSPQNFLLGALSSQVIALPFYLFKMDVIGSIISDIGGFILLLLTLIAAVNWQLIKRKLSKEDRGYLYKPSAWVYVLGFFTTNLIYSMFTTYGADTTVLIWLNLFFAFATIKRFIVFLFYKIGKRKPQEA